MQASTLAQEIGPRARLLRRRRHCGTSPALRGPEVLGSTLAVNAVARRGRSLLQDALCESRITSDGGRRCEHSLARDRFAR